MPARHDDVWPDEATIGRLLDKIVLVASFRRSGTHLTIDSLINNAGDFYKGHQLLSHLTPQHKNYMRFADWCACIDDTAARYVVVKTHQPMASFKFEEGPALRLAELVISRARTIYVYRDPRDVMVSLWHYVQTYDPDYRFKDDIAGHLRHWLPSWKEHVAFWLARDDIETVRFEDWKTRYEATLDRCYGYLDIARSGAALNNIDGAHVRKKPSFTGRLTAKCMRTVPSGIKSYVPTGVRALVRSKLAAEPIVLTSVAPRKGAIGDWKAMFDEPHRDLIKELVGDLIVELGYERDDRW